MAIDYRFMPARRRRGISSKTVRETYHQNHRKDECSCLRRFSSTQSSRRNPASFFTASGTKVDTVSWPAFSRLAAMANPSRPDPINDVLLNVHSVPAPAQLSAAM